MALKLAPDGDVTSLGILTAAQGLVPTVRGTMRSSYTGNASGYPALAGPCIGAFLGTKSSGAKRLFAATSTAIYEANQTTAYAWTDRSSGAYTTPTASGYMFAQFGDWTIKCNKNVPTEASTSGAFATTGFTQAPKAAVMLSQSNALWAFNINDGTDKPDYFATSDQGLPGSWNISAGSDAFSGPLQDTPGPITAAITWQNGVVAFKKTGMYFLEYVGGTEKVVARLLSAEHGCVGPRAVCSAEGVLYFYSDRGVYRYDGSFPQLISQDITSLAFGGGVFGPDTLATIAATHDEANSLVRFLKDFNGGVYNSELTYNYKTLCWGCTIGGVSLQMPVAMTPTEAYEFPGIGGSSSSLPVTATNFTTQMAFNSSNVLVNMNNTALPSGGCTFNGWFHGSQIGMTQITRMYLWFYDPPVRTTVSGQILSYEYAGTSAGAITQETFQDLDLNNSISVNISGRWLRPSVTIGSSGGFFEIANISYDPPPAGRQSGRS